MIKLSNCAYILYFYYLSEMFLNNNNYYQDAFAANRDYILVYQVVPKSWKHLKI